MSEGGKKRVTLPTFYFLAKYQSYMTEVPWISNIINSNKKLQFEFYCMAKLFLFIWHKTLIILITITPIGKRSFLAQN